MTEPTEQDKRKNRLDALGLEYGTLRTELLDRMTRRAQTVSALAVAAALIAGFGDKATAINASGAWVLFVALVALAVGKWIRDGWILGKLSGHVAQIECDINDALAGSFEVWEVMRWETNRQRRTPLSWIFFGPRRSPNYRGHPPDRPSPSDEGMSGTEGALIGERAPRCVRATMKA